jgi:hypothetical protein
MSQVRKRVFLQRTTPQDQDVVMCVGQNVRQIYCHQRDDMKGRSEDRKRESAMQGAGSALAPRRAVPESECEPPPAALFAWWCVRSRGPAAGSQPLARSASCRPGFIFTTRSSPQKIAAKTHPARPPALPLPSPHPATALSCLIHALAGRTFPAGERGSAAAAGSLLSSHRPKS